MYGKIMSYSIMFTINKISVDKLLHYLVCWALFLSIVCFFPAWQSALITLGIGAAKEVIDIFKKTGFDFMDMLFDAFGIATGWLILCISTLV